ncbi:hypothetical protein BJY04DRAFT_220849 [Aspergillus karnatakaensis]|uniref:uncharacterized protein n=1 Tax=Aspergillus karnatakaensis TaxID=1810916 RepID=UPI003CCCC525
MNRELFQCQHFTSPNHCAQCQYAEDDSPNPSKHPSHSTVLVYHYLDNAITKRPQSNIWRASIDNLRAPNLAAKSLDLQTREVFNALVSTVLFPASYAAFYKRVDQDIISFVRDDQKAQCPAMEWLVRCYASWYFAKQHDDNEQLGQSRYIYGVLLRYLRAQLDDPRARTADITLSLAILVGVYEMLDASSSDAWLVHVRGIKEIMQLRGAAMHERGFSRTIFLSCRAFFIAEAFATQEECFLAESEWVSSNAKAFEREDRAGRGSRLVSIIDKGYREIVRAPGLVAQARALVASETNGHACKCDDLVVALPSRKSLEAEIQRSRRVVRQLGRRLICAAGLDVAPESVATREASTESMVESKYISTIAQYNLSALRAVERLLDRLSEMIKSPEPGGRSRPLTLSHSLRREVSATWVPCDTIEYSALPGVNLDDMFLSLGAIAIVGDGES